MMMGMLKIHHDEVLKKLGWNVLLQIHDEVIVEGPEESKDEALERVVHCMQFPFSRASGSICPWMQKVNGHGIAQSSIV